MLGTFRSSGLILDYYEIGMCTGHGARFNFLTCKDVLSLCLVSVKLHEYQNLLTSLFPSKNNTITGYIQSM